MRISYPPEVRKWRDDIQPYMIGDSPFNCHLAEDAPEHIKEEYRKLEAFWKQVLDLAEEWMYS